MFHHLLLAAFASVLINGAPSASAGGALSSNIRGRNAGTNCCLALQRNLGGKILFPNSTQFDDQQSGADGYWTQQETNVIPTCRVAATSSQDVATAVSKLADLGCSFAIRSGGHMGWAGAANIQDGVTIDLSAINQVNVSINRMIASVGPGARWGEVYSQLDTMGLAVAGGRVAEVGVGGLVLGGGNSFFASRYGFACDGVVNFEVVLASGRIINANIAQNDDLYKALKGGGNNFGIVTRFDLRAFSQGKLWGGFVVSPASTAAEQFKYLQDFTTASGNGVDPYASIINAYIFTGNGPAFVANQLTYTKPEAYPTILQNFTNIQPQYSNTLRTTNLTDLTIELGAGTPNGFRQLFATATFQNNAQLFADIYALATKIYQPVQKVDSFQASFVLQPISKAITGKASLTGGNLLGLGPTDGDLVWLDITVQWASASDDAAINKAVQSLVTQSTNLAKSRNLYNQFIYMNYALQSQDPISAYGVLNALSMNVVSRIYDPRQVFQRLVPGGFKLNRR